MRKKSIFALLLSKLHRQVMLLGVSGRNISWLLWVSLVFSWRNGLKSLVGSTIKGFCVWKFVHWWLSSRSPFLCDLSLISNQLRPMQRYIIHMDISMIHPELLYRNVQSLNKKIWSVKMLHFKHFVGNKKQNQMSLYN